jgi:thiamine biosynthesis lipoprotein
MRPSYFTHHIRQWAWFKPVQAFLFVLLAIGFYLGQRQCTKTTASHQLQTTSGYRWQSIALMGTQIEVMLLAHYKAESFGEVFRIFREINAEMSEWQDTSSIAAINRLVGQQPVKISRNLFALLRRSIEIGDLTNGAFDITWAAMWGLWKFTAPNLRKPTTAEIQKRLPLIDYRKLQLDETQQTAYLPTVGMKIGLGAIAKGYALNMAAGRLRQQGIRNFLISAGGQIYADGTRRGQAWRIGIRNPRGAADDFFATLHITNTSVSTSGDYERFFIAQNQRYHHILDPRTGLPSRYLRSATVICQDAALADALSTAFMVLPPSQSLAIIQKIPQVQAILVDQKSQVILSHNIADILQIHYQPPL